MKNPAQIAESYVAIGEGKAKLSVTKTLLMAFLAGIFIGIAGIGAMIASCMIPNPSVSKLVNGCVFPGGLAMVVLAGSELFTGDCLMVITVLEKRIKIYHYARTLALVWLGNLIGGLFVSALAVYGHTMAMFNGEVAKYAINLAASKCTLSFTDGLIRGILCNILVAIAVWMSFAADSAGGKVVSFFLPILVFVASGYEHCVANMTYIPVGLFASKAYGIPAEGLTWFNFFIRNEIPVTIGNIIGGAMLGVLYWAIFLAKKTNKEEK